MSEKQYRDKIATIKRQQGTEEKAMSDQAPRVWRVRDRLNEADLRSLVSGYSAGTTARELAEQFHISESSVKRLLRERGIRRALRGSCMNCLLTSSYAGGRVAP